MVAGALAMGGCATLSPSDYPKLVESRANERWQALIAGDVAKAYSFLSPGTRATLPLERYKGSLKTGAWKEAKVRSVNCEETVCAVAVDVRYDHRRMRDVETVVRETWLIEESNAWYVLRK